MLGKTVALHRPCWLGTFLDLLTSVPVVMLQNLVIIREVETENRFGGVTFLGFDRLTFVPIQVGYAFTLGCVVVYLEVS